MTQAPGLGFMKVFTLLQLPDRSSEALGGRSRGVPDTIAAVRPALRCGAHHHGAMWQSQGTYSRRRNSTDGAHIRIEATRREKAEVCVLTGIGHDIWFGRSTLGADHRG